MLASFNHRRSIKAENRQIPQNLAARIKFLLLPVFEVYNDAKSYL